MKKRFITIVFAICLSTVSLVGCNAQVYDGEILDTERLENEIHEKLKANIDKDKDVDRLDLDGDGKDEYIVKYRTEENDSPLRIMILSEENGKPVIKDEIKNVGEDFDRVEYIDTNDNGSLEIVAGFKVGNNLSKGISIYEYKDGKATEIFEEYYSEYMIKNLNNSNRKDIVIIKEKERDGKSYAYLFIWRGKSFENIKKVEVDSTSDTEDQIFKKLLEG